MSCDPRSMACALTVLRSVSGKLATKQFSLQKDGKIRNRSYGNEKHFAVNSVPVTNIDTLARELDKLARDPHGFIIRGEALAGTFRARTRRLALPDSKTGEPATFEDQPRHWFCVDADHIPGPALTDPAMDPESAVEYVIGLLPPELHDASCWWQFSSSQSVPVTPGAADSLSLHLWYWSTEPLDNAALTRWALAANQVAGFKLIGPELFRTVQAHYVTAPLFAEPLKDPLARRAGLRRGLDDAVSLIIPPSAPKRPYEPSATGYEPGLGVDSYIRKIGGPAGFRSPIMAALASYIAIHGSNAGVQPIYQAIREAIARAEPDGDLGRYADDAHLDAIAEWVRQHHGDQPPKGFLGEPPPHVVDPEIPVDEPEGSDANLIYNKDGRPRANVANAITTLRADPRWRAQLRYDLFAEKLLDGSTPWESLHDILLADWLQHRGIDVSPHTAGQAAYAVGFDNKFHPVRDYLSGLTWDGTPRIDEWLTTYLGMKPAPVKAGNEEDVKRATTERDYLAAIGAKFLISCIARILRPGCKADCALVLEGPQGLLKSTAILALMPNDDWFTDELADLGTKDAALQLAGRWIIELSELDSMSRAETSRVKAYMSRAADKFRPPYAQHVVSRPRQCCHVGTVNHSEYLRDETGARRFWPGKCGKIDIPAIKRDRDQLWAEARDRYLSREPWWLDTPQLNRAAEEAQDERYQADVWQHVIEEFIGIKDTISIAEVLKEALFLPTERWGQVEQNRVARCLRKMGWERFQMRDGKSREWRYRRI